MGNALAQQLAQGVADVVGWLSGGENAGSLKVFDVTLGWVQFNLGTYIEYTVGWVALYMASASTCERLRHTDSYAQNSA